MASYRHQTGPLRTVRTQSFPPRLVELSIAAPVSARELRAPLIRSVGPPVCRWRVLCGASLAVRGRGRTA